MFELKILFKNSFHLNASFDQNLMKSRIKFWKFEIWSLKFWSLGYEGLLQFRTKRCRLKETSELNSWVKVVFQWNKDFCCVSAFCVNSNSSGFLWQRNVYWSRFQSLGCFKLTVHTCTLWTTAINIPAPVWVDEQQWQWWIAQCSSFWHSRSFSVHINVNSPFWI